jgi:hypothetical protein
VRSLIGDDVFQPIKDLAADLQIGGTGVCSALALQSRSRAMPSISEHLFGQQILIFDIVLGIY